MFTGHVKAFGWELKELCAAIRGAEAVMIPLRRNRRIICENNLILG